MVSVRGWELRQVKRVASLPVPGLTRGLNLVGGAARRTALWWALAAVMAVVGDRRARSGAVQGLAAMGLAEAVAAGVLKPLADRRRPPAGEVPQPGAADRPDSSSFPSGHSAAAFGFACAVASADRRWGAVAALPAAAVAVQRIHSGAHFPSDAAVGAVAGVLSAVAVHRTPVLRLLLRRLVYACAGGCSSRSWWAVSGRS